MDDLTMMPKRALVREPGARYSRCISSHPLHHTLNVTRARDQHARYADTLAELGLDVIRLAQDDEHPDSCFVEDTAIIHVGKVLIARLAKTSRRGEEEAVAEILQEYLSVSRVKTPGTLEGGDVIHLPNRMISGISQRTNRTGVEQMQTFFEIPIDTIEDPDLIHLKSHITYLDNNIMVATKPFADHPILSDFDKIIVPDEEGYAANTLTIGDTVIMTSGYPKTQMRIEGAGFDVICLNMSEFAKCEGALTCLSLLF